MSLQKKRAKPEPVSVRHALRTALADNTRRAYRSGWRRFAAYCDQKRLNPMAATPEDVAEFLVAAVAGRETSRAGMEAERPLALGTIRICLAAINRRYEERNLESPARDLTVTSVLRGLGRLTDERPRRVKALREDEIGAILVQCDRLATRPKQRTMAIRDAAVIAVGFAGALRRSEICALRLDDVEFVDCDDEAGGMFLHVRRSKTDQLGKGQSIAIPAGTFIRPVQRLQRWLALSGAVDGPLFQTLWFGERCPAARGTDGSRTPAARCSSAGAKGPVGRRLHPGKQPPAEECSGAE